MSVYPGLPTPLKLSTKCHPNKLGLLFRLRKQLSALVIRDIYRTCVLPSIECGSLAWSSLGKKNAQALDRIHRHAAGLITGTKLADNISSELLLARAGLTPLAAKRDYRLAQFAYCFLHDTACATAPL